jgi:hypothetical protein
MLGLKPPAIICSECGYIFSFKDKEEPCEHLKKFFKEIVEDEKFKEWIGD